MAEMKSTVKQIDELPAWLGAKEIKGVLGINLPAIYELMHAGPHIKIGRRILCPRDEFFKWLEANAIKNPGEAPGR